MSAELEAAARPARRAAAELTGPGSRLLAALAGAETLPERLEPDLILLGLDIFGAITVPARREAPGEESARRRSAPAPERATPAPRRLDSPDSALASAAETTSPVLPLGRGRVGDASVASGGSDAEAGRRVLELFGATPAARHSPSGVEPDEAAAAPPAGLAQAAAAAGASTFLLGPIGRAVGAAGAVPASAPVTPASAIELIGRLTESILTRAVEAGTQGRGGIGAALGGSAEPAPGGLADFLQETLGSLGQTPFGIGRAVAGEPRPPDEAATDAPSRTATPGAAAPPQAQSGAQAAIVPGTDEREQDPATLAALVNDALVEQARRHGVDLG